MSLTRGKLVRGNARKIATRVKLDKVLKLQSLEGKELTYTLVSTVEHLGNTIKAGHYVAHVSAQNNFYRVDDDRPIQKSTVAEIEKSQLFLYKRVENEQQAKM